MASKKQAYQALIAEMAIIADKLNELKMELIELAGNASDLMEAAHPETKQATRPKLKLASASGKVLPIRRAKKNQNKDK